MNCHDKKYVIKVIVDNYRRLVKYFSKNCHKVLFVFLISFSLFIFIVTIVTIESIA